MTRILNHRIRRQRQVLILLGVLFVAPLCARANTIVVGNHDLLPDAAGQTVTLLMTGSEEYVNSELRIVINGGAPGAPVVTHVFGADDGTVPPINLAGSLWGFAGIYDAPHGTSLDSSGLSTSAGLITDGSIGSSAEGVYVVLTFDTTGVAPGIYSFSLTSHPDGPTELFNGVDEELIPIPVSLSVVDGTLTVVPEPASLVLLGCGLAWVVWVARRHGRRRG